MNNILSPACIIFDGDNKPFFPGDTVTGLVTINLLKTEDARFLKLIWSGKAHTGWLTSVDRSCTERFMEDYCYLWMSEDGSNKMPAGSYTFPFSFKFLDSFPPSFRGDSGYIKYKVKVELDRPKNFNLVVEKMFIVSKRVEMSADILEKGLKFREEKMIIGRIFNKGLVEVLASYPALFVPGSTVDVMVKVQNTSETNLKSFQVQLVELSHFHSRPLQTPCSTTSKEHCQMISGAQKNEHTLIGQPVNVDIDLPPLQAYEKLVRLHVPEEATPSFKMSLITMQYNIQITVKTFDKMLSHVVFYAVATVGNFKKDEEKKKKNEPADTEGAPPAYDSLFEQPGTSGSGIGVAHQCALSKN